ncbi:filamin-A-like isoform X2 [Liolophura sinensis]|uniref:filamin-A-like isoform X2 n=1 Tax=Liolophura sinensis TaxID=3198878 RepID=UPI0031593AF1
MEPMSGYSEAWIDIQRKTFTNWVNEQLTVTGKQVEILERDLCSGEALVALVEALQFKKIGKVCRNPRNQIQMIGNVALAFKAIAEDHVRMVNIGNEDVVNGNVKLILGLIWHLIIRYQISSSKSKAPPKKIMLQWLQSAIPDISMSNLTSDWNNGIALHALIEHCKPGLSPNWRNLDPKNRVENCRTAMALAKEHLNIPRVISPEDFASKGLDELSAMTYLSYFVKTGSPGYYATLNWVCKQIRSPNVTNLTTDWNDGYYLCCVAQSLGAEIPGWPDIDKTDHLSNCQKGIDAGKSLGVQPVLTAAEMSDPAVDHLSMMAYINSFRNVKPLRKKEEKLAIRTDVTDVKVGQTAMLHLDIMDEDLNKENVRVDVNGPGKYENNIIWGAKQADVTLVPLAVGKYQIRCFYDDVEIKGGPVEFNVSPDISKVKVTSDLGTKVMVGVAQELKVDTSGVGEGNLRVEAKSPSGKVITLPCHGQNGTRSVTFNPTESGEWTISTLFENERVEGGTFSVTVFDPKSVSLSGPQNGVVGEAIVFKGSPKTIEIQDPGSIYVTGEGVVRCQIGEEGVFTIHPDGHEGDISVNIRESGEEMELERMFRSDGTTEVSYRPQRVGMYTIDVKWNGLHVRESPFLVRVTDATKVTCLDELDDWMDEYERILLDYKEEATFRFGIANAGPGKFTAEVLSPSGRLPVTVSNVRADVIQAVFIPEEKGDHYIHLYWSDVPVQNSPLLGYCPGAKPPLDYTKVAVRGPGREEARATVQTYFFVDGRLAGPGTPEIRMEGLKSNVDIMSKRLPCDRYKCTYTADVPGGYLLYVYWSGKQVPSSPYKVTVTMKGDPSKVAVCGDGLKGGLAGKELRVLVDTNPTGPGEITASCMGPTQTARCQLFDHHNRTYTVRIFPTEAGRHTLNITYDKEHVPGSPFSIRVMDPPDPTRVKVYGPGVEDGVIQKFQSRFIVETRGAGAGQLAVKVKGPKGGFKVEMMRESNMDRTILCRYDPMEPGNYIINVKWSGEHVTGSPFDVRIFDSLEARQRYMKEKGVITNGDGQGLWQEDI